jgi:Flp pilus assembly protein TadG
MTRAPRRLVRRTGTTLVEMTVVLIPCFLLMLAILEYGRVVMMLQMINNAARTGARQAVVTPTSYVNPATATTQIQNTVIAALSNQPLQNLNVQVYQADTAGNNIGPWTSAPFGRNIVVQVDADFPNLFGLWSNPDGTKWSFLPATGAAPNSLHLTAKSMMRGEAN